MYFVSCFCYGNGLTATVTHLTSWRPAHLIICKPSGWARRMGRSKLQSRDEESQWPTQGTRFAFSHVKLSIELYITKSAGSGSFVWTPGTQDL